jgi:hypothetical protein
MVHESKNSKIIDYKINNVYGYNNDELFESMKDTLRKFIKDY